MRQFPDERSQADRSTEIVTLVGIALGQEPIAACEAANRDGDPQITISEILTAVNRALGSCAPSLSAAVAL